MPGDTFHFGNSRRGVFLSLIFNDVHGCRRNSVSYSVDVCLVAVAVIPMIRMMVMMFRTLQMGRVRVMQITGLYSNAVPMSRSRQTA